ncbi:hypothetical protein GCM10027273_22510 [Nocardioides pakistanensis]
MVDDRRRSRVSDARSRGRIAVEQVAVLVAAHNEELVIERTIASAARQFPLANIYVVSDGSHDATSSVAGAMGANVLELQPNRGKGGAIAAAVRDFELCDNYQAVLLLDADTVLSDDYARSGLEMFDDPEVAVVCGAARTIWPGQKVGAFGRLLLAYRERVYFWGQTFLKFGQAWRRANAVLVVPGFASMYRTSALRHIDVAAPGLVVEDLNMTFEVHRLRLGRIAFHPSAAVAYTQDPVTFSDYFHQVKRWALVLWQTVRRHGVLRLGFFWITLGVCILELILYCLVVLASVLLPLAAATGVLSGTDLAAAVGGPLGWLLERYTVAMLLLIVVLPELVIGTIVAVALQRPQYAAYALGFPALRVIDAALVLATLPLAWTTRSTGAWKSPARREEGMSGATSSEVCRDAA